MSAGASAAEAYLGCLQRRNDAAALEVALDALNQSGSVDEVMAMLAAAQQRVGELWERNEWSVAQEHVATAITDRVVAAIAGAIDEPAILQPVIVVCVEGDWHTLAARMLSDRLRARRWDVRFLGGSIPARDLGRHLELDRPLAIAVTCSVSMFLPGALETVAAAHALGLPVLAGGRGFGRTPRRAAAIGADAWAADLDAADGVLHRWSADGAGELRQPDEDAVDAQRSLRGDRVLIVDRAETDLHDRLPYMRTATETQQRRTREDLDYTLAFVEAAILTGDDTILTEYFLWLAGLLDSRGVPTSVLQPSVEALVAALGAHGRRSAAALLEHTTGPLIRTWT